MPDSEQSGAATGDGVRLHSFHELMRHRVQRILLVSSLYDSFLMSEEGHLHETLLSQFIDLRLSHTPDLVQVPGIAESLARLRTDDDFDLVISSVNLAGSGNAAELAAALREAGHAVPVVALAYTSRELFEFVERNDVSKLERLFLWQGDDRLLLAIVKYLEDRLNAPEDTGLRGVPAILVVEDNIRFYSSFLPVIYSELYRHSHQLLSEGLNLSRRILRMRARPKLLLCTTFEEAWGYFTRFEAEVLGIISDVEFPRDGRLAEDAGLKLCSQALKARPDIRLVLQSSKPEFRAQAESIGASFLLKGSPLLLHQLRDLLVNRFGFGDFVFRGADGSEVARASDLKSLADRIRSVPAQSISYHAERNHFSFWLKARTEFELAEKLRPRKVSEFESVEHLRAHILERIEESRRELHRTAIADFDRERFDPEVSITRIGGGSLGGKARGVSFASRLMRGHGLERRFPKVEIRVPPSVVLGTDVFDEFLEYEFLRDYGLGDHADAEIEQLFLDAPFPRRAIDALETFLERVRYPLAVRSSSLLEDSLSQPFAGVYQTLMLPNNDLELELRWRHLAAAIKRVYASTFARRAKDYLGMTSFRLEEEKMGVMIQELVGQAYQDRFYPDFAGVARSYNFYPEPGQRAEDGVVAVALGMGQTVVGGGRCLRFCPRYPRQLVSFSSVSDALASAQNEFLALDLSHQQREIGRASLLRHPLEVAEQDGPLAWLGSTYSPENNVIVDGISRAGVRLVSFAQVLKHGAFPLAEILCDLLDRCSQGTGVPVEIEFAGNLERRGRPGQFAFLQLRPLALSREHEEVRLEPVADSQLVCRSTRVLGNGRIGDIHDVVLVDLERFERRHTPQTALQVAHFDALLRKQRRPYLLIGVGRWGSADPSLGIPVAWSQISGARVIVESGFRDLHVAPSQGTHFFQNLTSSSVGYFTVNPDLGEGHLDWEWLLAREPHDRSEFVRHLRLEAPLVVTMSGHAGEGVIAKPAAGGPQAGR